MDNLTEEKWKEIIKKKGCAFNPLYKTRGEYADTSMYLRAYISFLAKKEVIERIKKGLHPRINESGIRCLLKEEERNLSTM